MTKPTPGCRSRRNNSLKVSEPVDSLSVFILVVFFGLGIPMVYVLVKFSYNLLKSMFTIKSGHYMQDEIDGMYVELNGQVRVDD